MDPPRRLSTRTLAETPWMKLQSHEIEDLPGHPRREVTTLELDDWVVTAARDRGGRWVLVRQFRHGVEDLTLEPAGGIIDRGEAASEAARRELLEETGYAGGTLRELGAVHPNAALSKNRAHLFLVDGVEKVSDAEQPPEERTETLLLSSVDLRAALDSGQISHALAVVALRRALELVTRGALAQELEEMERHQRQRVVDLARRLRPDLTFEDLQSPHDFPELADADWHFEDGQLAGLVAARIAASRRP